jgi:hypothetical protein
MPLTAPLDDAIEATDGLLLDHVPVPASEKIALPPWHITDVPEIIPGKGLTVTIFVTLQLVGRI